MAITNIHGRFLYLGTAAEMAVFTPDVEGAFFWCTDTLALYCYSGGAWNAV